MGKKTFTVQDIETILFKNLDKRLELKDCENCLECREDNIDCRHCLLGLFEDEVG